MAFYNITCGFMTSSMVAASETGSFNELLEMFRDPNTISAMSANDKVLVTLFVAGLGMAVTFAVLVFLWFCISVLTKVLNKKPEPKSTKVTEVAAVTETKVVEEVNEEDEELVAVIAAAVAASMNTSIHNIVVKNIVSISDQSPSWSKTGRIEQMNTRF